jgi:hypothetical protein
MPQAPDTGPMIFISYRRDDSSGHVGRLYDALSAHFGRKRLFFDIDHIAPGQDFVHVLEDSLNRSSVMIVVMGKRWGGTGRVGARRIDDPGDFVRLEVASGLRRGDGLRLIPALIQGAKMLGPNALPDDLKDLARRNAIEMSDLRWREDVERLIASLEKDMAMPTSQRAAADLVRKARDISKAPIMKTPFVRWGAIAAAALIVVLAGRALFGHSEPKPPPVATFSTPSTGAISSSVAAATVPTDDPRAMPSNLAGAARSVIPAGKQWRSDAVLTQIVAAPDTAGGSAAYRVQFAFRSPTDGSGLAITSGGAGTSTERLDAIPMSSIHALPDAFIDLPAAVSAARGYGMFGTLREGRLALVTNRGAPRTAWRLRSASDGSRIYYIDASTGANLAQAAPVTPPTTSKAPAPPPTRPSLVGKVKKLFH